MKTKAMLAVLLSATVLPVFAQELDFPAALGKLSAWEKKFVYEDPECMLGGKPSIRIEKNRMLNTSVKLEPKTKYVLSFSVKGQDLDTAGNGGAILINNGKYWQRIVTSLDGEKESGTFDWKAGKGVIDTANFTEPETKIYLSCGNEGTIWFGELLLTEGYNDFAREPSGEVDFTEALTRRNAAQKKAMGADHPRKSGDRYSLRIEKKHTLTAVVNLAPKSKYELSFFVKGQDLDAGGKGGQILINNGKHWQRIVTSSNGNRESGTFDWKEGKGIIDTANFTEPETKIMLSCGEAGTIWYDMLELKKLEPAASRK